MTSSALKRSWQLLVPRALTLNEMFMFPTECIYVAYNSPNEQRLFPLTALTGWPLLRRAACFMRGMNRICNIYMIQDSEGIKKGKAVPVLN
jgi:hypothetical protein